MNNFFQLLMIAISQSVVFIVVYKSISKIKVTLASYFVFLVVYLSANLLFNYFSFIALLAYFFFLGYQQNNSEKKNLLYFYSVYTTFISSLFGFLDVIILGGILGNSLYEHYTFLVNFLFIPLMIIAANFFLLKIFKPNFDFLATNFDSLSQYFLFTINTLLSICCLIQYSGYWIDKHIFNNQNPSRKYLVVFFTLIVVVLMRYIKNKIYLLKRQQIQELKDNQLKELTAYVHQVESMYNDLRSFRHDYRNVLISLNESIKTKDLVVIENTYKQILASEGIKLQDTQHSLVKLNNLRTLPIKGVFSTHIISAWQKNIDIHLEVEDIIQNEAIDTLDYVRITSVLLDNAIEAAEKSAHPLITIVFLIDNDEKNIKIIIENSSEVERVEIAKIFQNGYSSKDMNRGIGLTNITKILENYPHISLQTESEPFLFRQILIIKEERSS
jgi:two-component system sensor histidine kinase AgrC